MTTLTAPSPSAVSKTKPTPSSPPPPTYIHGEYFPHVDGIRALAVLPVVLYHIWGWICPGGFTGVDVFFVISGYLITGGILRDLQKDRFTLRNFYHRRIRRILPANFALFAGVFIAGFFLYYCAPLKALGGTSISATFFATNIAFWQTARGYFSPDVERNPLLHLWSLGVEEQFYFFIPVLCAILWRWGRRLLAPTLAVLAVGSFVAAMYTIAKGDQIGAFYLLHYRAWELLAGSLLSIMTVASLKGRGKAVSASRGRAAAPFLTAIGLLMVVLPYALLSHKTPFPGLAALPSILGTVMLIRYGQVGWVSRFLCWRAMIGVGKISYSLYLWHWPVIVFWRYVTYDQLCEWDHAGMLALSFVLAYLSWRFVEMPVRLSSTWTMRTSYLFAAVGIVLFASMGLTCVLTQGCRGMIRPHADALATTDYDQESALARRFREVARRVGYEVPAKEQTGLDWMFDTVEMVHFGKAQATPEILLLGDSHAKMLRAGLQEVLRQRNMGGLCISRPGNDLTNMSNELSQRALEELRNRPEISKVVLTQLWMTQYYDWQSGGLLKFAQEVKKTGKGLYILTDIPMVTADIMPRVAAITPRRMEEGWDGCYSQAFYDQQQGEINRQLQAVCDATGAVLVPLHWLLKQEDGRYKTFEIRGGRHVPLYRDDGHLSTEGSLKAGQFLAPYIFAE